MYIIVSEQVYIGKCNNKYVLVNSFDRAEKWESYHTALRIMRDSLPSNLKTYRWRVSTDIEERLKSQGIILDSNYNVIQNNNAITTTYRDEQTTSAQIDTTNNVAAGKHIGDSFNDSHFINIEELKESLDNLAAHINSLNANKTWLTDEVTKVNAKINDILHYIEFYDFNARDGYKLSKILKEYRLYRRRLKDELELIGTFNVHTCNNIALGHTHNAITGKDTRKYAPRQLPGIFEDRDIDKLYQNPFDR